MVQQLTQIIDCDYANHGLRLNERTKYKLENFDLGNIFHTALKYISDKVDGDFKNLDNKKIHALTVEAFRKCFTSSPI